MKAFDRHCNMILENVKEFWTEVGAAALRGLQCSDSSGPVPTCLCCDLL